MLSVFNIPREQMTPAQRRLKWMKIEFLPPAIRQSLEKYEQEKKTRVEKKEVPKEEQKDKTQAQAVSKEEKETVIKEKDDF